MLIFIEKKTNRVALYGSLKSLYDICTSNNTVICDNTNLKKKYIDNLREYGKPVELILIDTPLFIAQKRVLKRGNLINVDYITKQYEDLQELKQHIKFDKIINYEN